MNTKNNIKTNILFDRIFTIVVNILSFAIVIPLILILYLIFINGFKYINLDLLIKDQRHGGILNAITGSFIIVFFASIISIPIGIFAGIYLSEVKKTKVSDMIRISVDVLQGAPSIIIGIVAYIWLVVPLKTFSAFSGSIALAIMMIPIIIKNTEENLKLVPETLKEAAYALGVPYYRVILKVVLPCALSGVITGIIMAMARVLGETAPLLFTAFGNRDLSLNIFKPMEALPPLIYKYATSPSDEMINTSWAASFILVVIVLSLNLLVKVVIRKWKVKF